MLAPVIVDLGPDAGAREVQIVLRACNAAVSGGECRSGNAEDTPARAFAVVRPSDESVLVVRIEVRLHWADEGSWLVREIEFSRRDPLRERWRSVGLAIATLVGEGEARARRVAEAPPAEAPPAEALPAEAPPAAEPRPSEPAPSDVPGVPGPRASPAPASPPAPEAAPAQPPPAPRRERIPESPAESEAEPPAPERSAAAATVAPVDAAARRPVFIGIGVVGGSGFGGGPWRLGTELNAGWDAPSGLWLATSVAYAWRTSEASFTAEWFSIDAGVGYRSQLGEAVSAGALLFAGAQRARFEVLAAGVVRSEALWSPRLGIGADVRWQVLPAFGVWAAARGSSTLRGSRLFIAPNLDPVEGLPVDLAVTAGVAWWLH
jgi:hypothetical protein